MDADRFEADKVPDGEIRSDTVNPAHGRTFDARGMVLAGHRGVAG